MDSYYFALGGNALIHPDEEGNLKQQYQHTSETMAELAQILAESPARVVISHGNGPQVGNVLLRSEYSRDVIYPLTLDVCVSDTEGGMGYMIQQLLHNEMNRISVKRDVVTIITQTVVDPYDPAMQNPSKYIGQWYSKEEAERMGRERGWTVKKDADRGWRRVVASPRPVDVIETKVIKTLLDHGIIVIAAGGGGIPVMKVDNNLLRGVEGVVDKDLASSLLASRLNMDALIIITAIDRVYVDSEKNRRKWIDVMTVEEARSYQKNGQFPPGSMGPKIEAAVNFLLSGGKRAIITCPGKIRDALESKAGTLITP